MTAVIDPGLTSGLTFVIPVKPLDAAKTRLSVVLSAEARAALTLTLLERTVGLIRRHFPDRHLLLVTRDERVAALADHPLTTVLDDRGTDTLNGAMGLAARWTAANGFGALAFLPADLARAEAGDIAALIELAEAPRGVAVAEAADGGTNGLVVRPADALAFRFGPGSAARHLQAARAAGMPAIGARLDSLIHDIDQPDDLSLVPEVAPWALARR
jgi:2-phospho-L-lactate guanylyltransferase